MSLSKEDMTKEIYKNMSNSLYKCKKVNKKFPIKIYSCHWFLLPYFF